MSYIANLRGEKFLNRYRIDCNLLTKSPLHIGSGLTTTREGLINEKAGKNVLVDAIQFDYKGCPIIPGSSLRGSIRNWLLLLFSPLINSNGNRKIANDDYLKNNTEEEQQSQTEQIEEYKSAASILEILFGTSVAQSKIDIWDAQCETNSDSIKIDSQTIDIKQAPFWHVDRMTYIGQSIGIDPQTGAVAENKLYHFELVPPGVMFQFSIVGQNLSDEEMGMLLFALKGFNSKFYPVTLGGMTSRGFGRCECNISKISYLDNGNDLKNWLKKSLENDFAGFEGLQSMDEKGKNAKIDSFKSAFKEIIGA